MSLLGMRDAWPPQLGPMHRPEFREQGMTYVEFVRDVLGDDSLTDADCDSVLWELTPFPMLTKLDELRPHLIEVRDGRRTFDSVYAEMDAALADADEDDQAPAIVTAAVRAGLL